MEPEDLVVPPGGFAKAKEIVTVSSFTSDHILMPTPFVLEPPDDEQWWVIAAGCPPKRGWQPPMTVKLGKIEWPVDGQGYTDFGRIGLRFEGETEYEQLTSVHLLMGRWFTLNHASPDSSVMRIGKVLDYLAGHVKEQPSGSSVQALADALEAARGARSGFMGEGAMKLDMPVHLNAPSPVGSELPIRKRLHVERLTSTFGGPGEIIPEPLLVELHIYAKRTVKEYERGEDA